MRQVPMPLASLKNFWKILFLVVNAETAQGILLVLFVFIFVGSQRALGLGADNQAQLMYYGLAIAIIRFGGIFANILLAWLGDLLGVSNLLSLSCISLLLFALLGAMGLFFHSLLLFFISLCLFSLTYALRPLVLSYIGAQANRKQKVMPMAYLQGTIALGAMIGPFLATHFLGVAYEKIYFMASGFVLLSMFFLPKNVKNLSPMPQSQLSTSLINVLKIPTICFGLMLLLIDQLAWSSFYDFIPLTLKVEWHLTKVLVGDFMALVSVVIIFSTWVLLPLLKRIFNPFIILRLSVLMMTLGLLIITFFGQYDLFVVPLGMIVLAAGDVIFYSLLVTHMSNQLPEHHQGKLMGLIYCIIGFSWGVTSLLGGYLSRFGTHYIYIMASCLCFVLLTMIIFYKNNVRSLQA